MTPEEEEAAERRQAAREAAITTTKSAYETLEKQARPLGLQDKHLDLLPKVLRQWLRHKYTDPEIQLAVQDALQEHQWAVYAGWEMKYNKDLPRPLYPRRRALTSTDPEFRSEAPGKQQWFAQEQSPLFSVLPTEIRVEIYRKLFGHWIVKIEAQKAYPWWTGGPPGSLERYVRRGVEIIDWETGATARSGTLTRSERDTPLQLNPRVVSLLQSCRRM